MSLLPTKQITNQPKIHKCPISIFCGQGEIKEVLAATGFDSLKDWCFHMLDPDHDCDLVGVIGLRKLTNVIFHFVFIPTVNIHILIINIITMIPIITIHVLNSFLDHYRS